MTRSCESAVGIWIVIARSAATEQSGSCYGGWIALLALAMKRDTAQPRRVAVSDNDLRPYLDGAPRGNVEISAGVIGGPGEVDKQLLLPARHPRLRCRPQRPAGQKERRAHHVELQTRRPARCEADGDIRALHVAEADRDRGEMLRQPSHGNPVALGNARGVFSNHMQDDIVLVQYLVVFDVMK